MYRVFGIIIAVALWASASHTATGASDHSGDSAADAGRGVGADGVEGDIAYLHSLQILDESGNVIATSPAFDRETTSYAVVLDENTNAIALEMSAGHGTRAGLAFQVMAGGMTMSRYVDLTREAQDHGPVISYRHAFSNMTTRGIFEIIVRVATEDGQASNTYTVTITRRGPTLACSVGLALNAGERCSVSGGGVFEIQSDGCVTGLPDVAGELFMGEGSMTASGLCIRGYVQKGGFRATANADASVWRIDSLP